MKHAHALITIDDRDLLEVAGGQWKLTNPSPQTPGSKIRSRPGYTGPTLGPPSGSIAQGDTIDNVDGLP